MWTSNFSHQCLLAVPCSNGGRALEQKIALSSWSDQTVVLYVDSKFKQSHDSSLGEYRVCHKGLLKKASMEVPDEICVFGAVKYTMIWSKNESPVYGPSMALPAKVSAAFQVGFRM